MLIRDEDSGEGGVGCRKFGRKEIKSERVAAGPRHSHSLQLASLEPSPVLSTSADIGGVESTSLIHSFYTALDGFSHSLYWPAYTSLLVHCTDWPF